jgi:hypothetical protein
MRLSAAREVGFLGPGHRMLSVCIFWAAIALGTYSAVAQDVTVFTPTFGHRSCDEHNKAGFNTDPEDNYVLGYISAAAIYSGNNNLRNLTGADILNYINTYCHAHPEDTIRRAADQLFHTRAGRE